MSANLPFSWKQTWSVRPFPQVQCLKDLAEVAFNPSSGDTFSLGGVGDASQITEVAGRQAVSETSSERSKGDKQ